MAEIKLTAAQQAVVDDRGGALLVSAAAGSGKTKVLVDRLLAQVCDLHHPANIDEFLIITYTKAAASELRGKIAAALSQRLTAQPNDRHLQRQLTRIYLTQISTVHAFCTSLLREYAHVLDIPADFRVAEEQESDTLRQQVFDDLLETFYAGLEDRPARRALIDQLGHGRDDWRLAELVMPVYDAVRCRVSPKDWMDRCKAAYDLPPEERPEDTPWGSYLIQGLQETLTWALRDLKTARDLLVFDEYLAKQYGDTIEENIRQVEAFLTCTTWDAICLGRIESFGRMKPAPKALDADRKEQVQNLRAGALEAIRTAQSPFYADGRRVMEDLRSSAGAIQGLLELLELFDQAYSREKLRRKILDFSDLEHTAIRLLRDKYTGQPTAAAREIAQRYREILVDEYQDSNSVQECIFEALSQEGQNRFMVGDVKQSIYRFRLADPGIFLQKYEAFPDHAEASPGQPRKILLSENFRSRKEVLWAANDVFSLVMQKQAAELDYTQAEALVPGRTDYPPTPQKKVQLHCLELTRHRDLESLKKTTEEPAYLARCIHQLLTDQVPVTEGETTRPVRPGDIVILMRSPGSSAREYIQALGRYGIPGVSDRGGNILRTTECEVFTALLQILDNPHRDIPLAAAMMSPVFAISPEEVALVRGQMQNGDLYDCLLAADRPGEAVSAFLNWLQAIRQRLPQLTLTELLDELFRTTRLEEIFGALEGGSARKANLSALRQLALDNAPAYGGSLMGLCDWLDQLAQSGASVSPTQTQGNQDAVQIMSIHKSKGLEFPIVVLADLSRRFNLTDNNAPVLLDEELLMGSNVVDAQAKAYYSGIARTAISARKRRQTLAEEMRVLYVAMTRAKEMLIMTYCAPFLSARLKELNQGLTVPLRPDMALSASCMGDWVLMAALCRTEAGQLFERAGYNQVSWVHADAWDIQYVPIQTSLAEKGTGNAPEAVAESKALPVCDLEQALAFQYPYPAAQTLPSKLTATQLKGRLMDQEAAQNAPAPQHGGGLSFRRPSFRRDEPLTGKERGSATHLFMQYVDYDRCATAAGIAQELERLVSLQFLTARQARAVDAEHILALFSGPLGRRILTGKGLTREFKFSILTDAADYVAQGAGEQVMLQGVVDCFWQEPEGMVILDFKTDRIHNDLQEKAFRYTPQIRAYAGALSRIYGLPVKECVLYFFDADQAVSV